jgi:CDP-diacylglycerol--glycerol-3-phosphate 3-phosphatidyltransferase
MSIPDGLAYVRIALIPVILALILPNEPIDHAYGIAAALMWMAATTDLLDGYLARRWKQTTQLGAFLDSIADKLLVSGVLYGLVAVDRAWAWAAFVIVGREIAVSGLRGVAAMDRVNVPASYWGKAKANAQYLTMFMALLRTPDQYGGLYPDQWVMLLAVAVTVMSGYGYFRGFARVLRAARTRA